MKRISPSNIPEGYAVAISRIQARFLLPAMLALALMLPFGMSTGANAAIAPVAPLPVPPLELPGPDAGSASISGATTSSAETDTWIVAGLPGESSDRDAEAIGAKRIGASTGIYRVKTEDARDLAKRLAGDGRLLFAEPDVSMVSSGYPEDLFVTSQWWLNRVVNPTDTTPPAVDDSSPELALLEESVDPLHPDLTSARLSDATSLGPNKDWHGTAIAGIAGSPGEGSGILGVWPGMKMRLVPMGTTCSSATKAVISAIKAGSDVLNMSYGFYGDNCFSHYVATEYAVGAGVIPVAAAGNSNEGDGNAPLRPATDPHVISVSAFDAGGLVASFATRNSGVDLSAPGVSVFAPNVATEAGGAIVRGWAKLDGTSFSTPMVAAAATWLEQARPGLDDRQIGRALTESASDLGAAGRDPEYGEGALNIDAALSVAAPPADPREPNDDVGWLNGTLLKKKASLLWKPGKGRRKSVKATLSRSKDPADVYRVKIGKKSKLLITAAQLESDIKLEVFKPNLKSILEPGRKLIVKSDKPSGKTEGVRVRNLRRKPKIIYVSITPGKRAVDEYSRYRLTVFGRKN